MVNVVNVGYDSTNYYVVERNLKRMLVDVGWPGTLPKLFAALKRKGFAITDVHYLFVTHYHPDHAGLVQDLKRLGLQHLVLPGSAVPRPHVGRGHDDALALMGPVSQPGLLESRGAQPASSSTESRLRGEAVNVMFSANRPTRSCSRRMLAKEQRVNATAPCNAAQYGNAADAFGRELVRFRMLVWAWARLIEVVRRHGG